MMNEEIAKTQKFHPEGCEKECKAIDAVLTENWEEEEEVRDKAFKRLMLKHHPDKGGKKEVRKYCYTVSPVRISTTT